MKKIKVKPIFGAHQIYQEIVNYPPLGVKYLGVGKSIRKGKYYQSKKLKENLGAFLQKIKVPRMVFVRPGKHDLIHSSRGIIPLNKKPWVIDVEHVHSFFGLDPNLIKNKFWKKFIEKKLASEECKAILCHCEATRKSFFKYLDCNGFKEKIKVLYPASHIIPIKKDNHKKIRILAVLSLFEGKAGLQVLKTFTKLEKKHKNIELLIKSDVPTTLKKKYNSENIRYIPYFEEIVPREKLLKNIYAKCDLFVYPTFTDSFGYSLIDAMVAKLPIITTNLFAGPEIVEDKKNGFIVKIPGYDLRREFAQRDSFSKLKGIKGKIFVKDFEKKIEILIKNKKLLEKMSKESFKKVHEGKFSIKHRNKKLKRIYQEALQ